MTDAQKRIKALEEQIQTMSLLLAKKEAQLLEYSDKNYIRIKDEYINQLEQEIINLTSGTAV